MSEQAGTSKSGADIAATVRKLIGELKGNCSVRAEFHGPAPNRLVIKGDIDLSDLERIPPLEFVDCEFSGRLKLARTKLASLTLRQCTFLSPSDGDRASLVDLNDAQVGGSIELEGVRVADGGERRFFTAQRTNVAGNVRITLSKDAFAPRSEPAFSLKQAVIEGDLVIKGQDVIDGQQDVIDGQQDVIDGQQDVIDGQQDVIDGQQDVIDGQQDVAPEDAPRTHVGMVRSIDLRGIATRGRCEFSGFAMDGSIHLESAKISGELLLEKVSLFVVKRPDKNLEAALGARFMDVGESIELRGCRVVGHANLPFITVRGNVRIESCRISAPQDQGEALILADARVESRVIIKKSIVSHGIDMARATFDRGLTLEVIATQSEPPGRRWLGLSEARIDGALEISVPRASIWIGSGEIDLSDAIIQRLVIEPRDLTRLEGITIRQTGADISRLTHLEAAKHVKQFLLAQAEGDRKRGPWSKLIQSLRNEGRTDDAKELDIARRQELANGSPLLERFTTSLFDWTLRFGHAWHRVALAAFALLLLAGLLGAPWLFSKKHIAFKDQPLLCAVHPDSAGLEGNVCEGLVFTVSSIVPGNKIEDQITSDGWGELGLISTKLFGWTLIGTAGIIISMHVRRWE